MDKFCCICHLAISSDEDAVRTTSGEYAHAACYSKHYTKCIRCGADICIRDGEEDSSIGTAAGEICGQCVKAHGPFGRLYLGDWQGGALINRTCIVDEPVAEDEAPEAIRDWIANEIGTPGRQVRIVKVAPNVWRYGQGFDKEFFCWRAE